MRISIFLTLYPILLHAVEAALSYCKCTCGKVSSIIALTAPNNPDKPCIDCTRQFCLDQQLPNCPISLEDTESPVSTECFQRESLKDEFIVILFLVLTGSLLLYATVIKGLLEKRRARREAQYGLLPSGAAS